jgi:hypothetical protein
MPTSFQKLDRACARLGLVHAHMRAQRLRKLETDGVDRVERGHRVLEDEADLGAAYLPQFLRTDLEQVLTVKHHSVPSRISAGGDGRSRSSDIMVTDFPDPLSPTTPSNSPGRRSKSTELTA